MLRLINDANLIPAVIRLVAAVRGFRAAAILNAADIAASAELVELDNALGYLSVQPKKPFDELWLQDQAHAAAVEGWELVGGAGRAWIQRADVSSPLASDDAASLFVYERAKAGSSLHLQAIRITLGSG